MEENRADPIQQITSSTLGAVPDGADHAERGLYDPSDPRGERRAQAVEDFVNSVVEGNTPSHKDKEFLDMVAEQKKVHEQAFKSQWEGEEDEDEETEDLEEIKKDPAKKILWAAEKRELETVRELLEGDPDLVHSVDEDLYTPLHRASYNGHVELCRLLLDNKAKFDARTRDGWMPLHCACRWNHAGVASVLLQAGSDVNCLTNGRQTPLHLAASNAQAKETLQLLLMNRWIDPSIVNNGHDTAYQICQRTGNLYHLFEMTLDHMTPTKM